MHSVAKHEQMGWFEVRNVPMCILWNVLMFTAEGSFIIPDGAVLLNGDPWMLER
jgi:hypothetical protein